MNYGTLALALLVPVVAVPLSALSGRWGILPLLVPRRWRCSYRHLRARGKQGSSRVGRHLRARVLRADRRRCVFCGSRWQLQIDHIVPWSLGGITCLWNCAVLCKQHNLVKAAYWRSDSGQVYYRGFRGYIDRPQAAQILAAERAARRNPLRWLRAL